MNVNELMAHVDYKTLPYDSTQEQDRLWRELLAINPDLARQTTAIVDGNEELLDGHIACALADETGLIPEGVSLGNMTATSADTYTAKTIMVRQRNAVVRVLFAMKLHATSQTNGKNTRDEIGKIANVKSRTVGNVFAVLKAKTNGRVSKDDWNKIVSGELACSAWLSRNQPPRASMRQKSPKAKSVVAVQVPAPVAVGVEKQLPEPTPEQISEARTQFVAALAMMQEMATAVEEKNTADFVAAVNALHSAVLRACGAVMLRD